MTARSFLIREISWIIWVRTGNHKEEPFFLFWTKGFDEYRCSKCGATKWEHV